MDDENSDEEPLGMMSVMIVAKVLKLLKNGWDDLIDDEDEEPLALGMDTDLV